jgi:hypothetical protein
MIHHFPRLKLLYLFACFFALQALAQQTVSVPQPWCNIPTSSFTTAQSSP